MKNVLLDKGIILPSGEISKDKGEYTRVMTLYNTYKNMIKTAATKVGS